ncbi:DUF6009 family protein [Streptomyces sp. NPDC091368]|uniref:DUF6009 family protein n=1 Tax=Streptomyces sp. NPDC091368 TaxID=3365993 RepID=UPI0037F573E1
MPAMTISGAETCSDPNVSDPNVTPPYDGTPTSRTPADPPSPPARTQAAGEGCRSRPPGTAAADDSEPVDARVALRMRPSTARYPRQWTASWDCRIQRYPGCSVRISRIRATRRFWSRLRPQGSIDAVTRLDRDVLRMGAGRSPSRSIHCARAVRPRWNARCALPGLFAWPAAGAGDRAERGDDRSSLISENGLRNGTELVWLEGVFHFDYVRQSLGRLPTADCRLPTRSGEPAYHRDGRMVGCAVLGTDATSSRASGAFRRRVFWLPPHDHDEEPDGLYAGSVPAGAVDPETFQPTVKGRRIQRGEGGEGGSSVPGDAGTRPGAPAPPINLSVRSDGAADRDERFSVPGPACAPHPPRRHPSRTQPSCLVDEFRVRVTGDVPVWPGTRTGRRAFRAPRSRCSGIRDEHPLRRGPDGIWHTW